MRSGIGSVEFNFEPTTLKDPEYSFELNCDKDFFYDNAESDQPNYIILGKD